MYTFFGKKIGKDKFLIEGEEFKHLKVRRIRLGEEVGIIWEGNLYRCKLIDLNSKTALCITIELVCVSPPPANVTLIQAVPIEFKTFELIAQKATELGVRKLIPLITKRSYRKVDAIEKKKGRLEKIVKEAMKQSNRPYIMEILSPTHIKDIEPSSDLNILLDNFGDGKCISELPMKGLKSVEIVVGPEGGFTKEEVELLKDKGFITVKLKPNVLRTETASIVGVGIIMNLVSS